MTVTAKKTIQTLILYILHVVLLVVNILPCSAAESVVCVVAERLKPGTVITDVYFLKFISGCVELCTLLLWETSRLRKLPILLDNVGRHVSELMARICE